MKLLSLSAARVRTSTAPSTAPKSPSSMRRMMTLRTLDGRGRESGTMTDPRVPLRKLLEMKSTWWRTSNAIMLFVVGTVMVSVINFFLSTVPELEGSDTIWAVELACGVIFTAELALRSYVATLDVRGMILSEPMFWIDVVTLIPFYIELMTGGGGDGNIILEIIGLLRLCRIFKLLKHYTGWRVLLIALGNSWRALLVPGFAMLIAILLHSGALIVVERNEHKRLGEEEAEPFRDGFEAMWCIFWIVTTLGFDGAYGLEGPAQRLIFASAIISGLLFTTMPITIIGEAFRQAWENKEVLEVQMKIQAMLEDRGLTIAQLHSVFQEFDTSGDGQLDWGEFKRAMKTMKLKVPVAKLRTLFAQFDEDETGEVDYLEFCRLLFPNLDSLPQELTGSERQADDAAAADGAVGTGAGAGAATPAGRVGGCWAALKSGASTQAATSSGAAAAQAPAGVDADGSIPPPRKKGRRPQTQNVMEQVLTMNRAASAFSSSVAVPGEPPTAGNHPRRAPSPPSAAPSQLPPPKPLSSALPALQEEIPPTAAVHAPVAANAEAPPVSKVE